MKSIISCISLACLCMSMLPAQAFALEPVTGEYCICECQYIFEDLSAPLCSKKKVPRYSGECDSHREFTNITDAATCNKKETDGIGCKGYQFQSDVLFIGKLKNCGLVAVTGETPTTESADESDPAEEAIDEMIELMMTP